MKLINRHKGCVGISLFCLGNRTAELWFCPPQFRIEEHTHPHEDIELMFLYGNAMLYRKKSLLANIEHKWVRFPWNLFYTFTVKRNYSHWFDTSSQWLVFINFAKWNKGIKPTSASTDFNPTK